MTIAKSEDNMSPDTKMTDEVWSMLSKTQRKRAKKQNKSGIDIQIENKEKSIFNTHPKPLLTMTNSNPFAKEFQTKPLLYLAVDDPLINAIKIVVDENLG